MIKPLKMRAPDPALMCRLIAECRERAVLTFWSETQKAGALGLALRPDAHWMVRCPKGRHSILETTAGTNGPVW